MFQVIENQISINNTNKFNAIKNHLRNYYSFYFPNFLYLLDEKSYL